MSNADTPSSVTPLVVSAHVRWRPFLHPIAGEARGLLGIAAGTALLSATAALAPWPLKLLVDHALGGAPLPPVLKGTAAAVGVPDLTGAVALVAVASVAGLFLLALQATLDAVVTLRWAATGRRMMHSLAVDLHARALRLSPAFHDRHGPGDLLYRLSGDTWCVYRLAQSLVIAPWQHGLTLLLVGWAAWQLDPMLTLVAFAAAPLMVLGAVVFGGWLQRLAVARGDAHSRLYGFVQQTLAAMPLVQTFGAEPHNDRTFRQLADAVVSTAQRGQLASSSYGLLNGLALTLGTAIVLVAGGQRVLAGSLTLGGLLVFLAYIQTLQRAVEGLFQIHHDLRLAGAGMARLGVILDAPVGVEERPNALPLEGRSRGDITFEQVSFGYAAARPVLRGVDLHLPAGRMLALVGVTGAGKSTLVSLIARLHDPDAGTVRLDGTDLRELRLAGLRRQVAWMLQEPFLQPMSVAQNIAFGHPAASRAAIEAAARDAGADTFIRALPQAYDTVLGERGGTLSGGQQQRLALARALLMDAPILILDEPTSALDAQVEQGLLQTLHRLRGRCTVVVIAHRLSTIRQADAIAVLEQGRIVEIGTHDALMMRDGAYAAYWRLQARDAHPAAAGELAA